MLSRIHGGNLREVKEKYGDDAKLIDFSANINPLGPPTSAYKAILASLTKIEYYPEDNPKELKRALADYLEIEPENILLGNGSAELIYFLANYYRPRKTLIAAPTFCEYELAVRAVGGEPVFFELSPKEQFFFPKDSILSQLGEVQMLFLGNPNNPTGNLIRQGDLLEIIEEAKKQGLVVAVDEAYIDFVEDRNRFSLIGEAIKRDNLMVLGSLTKFFALAGLRLGYLVTNGRLVEEWQAKRPPWNINCFAQAAGVAALKDRRFVQESRQIIQANREDFQRNLSQIKFLKPYPSEVNFILVEINHPQFNSIWLQKTLVRQGILIRDASSFRGLNDRFFRLAVRSKRENEKLIEVLKEILG